MVSLADTFRTAFGSLTMMFELFSLTSLTYDEDIKRFLKTLFTLDLCVQ